jgi:O-antigen/teichoic acid export membrane protein
MNLRKLAFRSMSIYYLHLTLVTLSMFVLTPFILRNVGQSAYGLWAIFGSMSGYFMLFSGGMNTAVAKYTAEYAATDQKEKLSQIVSTVLVSFILIDVIIIGFCIISMPFVHRLISIPEGLGFDARVVFLLMGLNVSVMIVSGVFANILYGHQRVDIWKSFSIVQVTVNALLVLLLLKLGFRVIGVASAALISNLLIMMLYILFIRRRSYGITFSLSSVSISVLKEIAPYSIRNFLLGLTCQILYFTDFLVIGIYMGADKVAPYEIAYKFCFYATYAFSVISTTIMPRFTTLFALGDLASLRKMYIKTTKITMLIVMPIVIFLIFWGRSFITLWVGGENFVGTDVFLVLVFMNIIHAIGTPGIALLQGIGRNKEVTYSECVNACLNLFLSVVLIKQIGLLGVALGTLLAHMLTSSWVLQKVVLETIKVGIKEYFFSVLTPFFVIGAAVTLIVSLLNGRMLHGDTFFMICVNGLLVAALSIGLYLLFAFTSEERRFFRSFFERAAPEK